MLDPVAAESLGQLLGGIAQFLYDFIKKICKNDPYIVWNTNPFLNGVGTKYTAEERRRLEADPKHKSDLLSEVKVLLGQAAERERSLIAEREDGKTKVI